MEIRNEIKSTDKDFEKKKFVVRNAADMQRAKLEKLMKNPEKPIVLPEPPKGRDFSSAIPSFVRNVMGSSAGAGSGEFHVYRHLRRKEYARQKYIQEKSRSELLDDEFQEKLEQNKQTAEARTAKKRAKRLKKKAKQKANRGKKPKKEEPCNESSSEEEEDEEDDVGKESGHKSEAREEETKRDDCSSMVETEKRTEDIVEADKESASTEITKTLEPKYDSKLDNSETDTTDAVKETQKDATTEVPTNVEANNENQTTKACSKDDVLNDVKIDHEKSVSMSSDEKEAE